MLDINEIEEAIEELEQGDATYTSCSKLASLYIVRDKLSEKVDLVPESNIDEQIADIQGLFVAYMRDRNIANLNNMLDSTYKMISELYHTCTDPNERNIFHKFIDSLSSINSTTIIG